jgi:murein DD-endopeptidase MepM/ murein hydrolase activator NlpD
MSSPDEPRGGSEERSLTIIVVPHGDLETRSFVLSYGRVKAAVIVGVALLLAFAITLAMLIPIMVQAARVPALEAELRELDSERARVAELARDLAEVEALYERVRQLLGADASADGVPVLPPLRRDTTDEQATSDLSSAPAALELWPLATPGYITRTTAVGRSGHPGIDIAVPRNSYIRAAGNGIVRTAGEDEVYGQHVILDHGSGLESVYGHASRLHVAAGDRVNAGDVIGLSGSSGRSTAPHLHFEVRLNGRPVDPLRYVRQP